MANIGTGPNGHGQKVAIVTGGASGIGLAMSQHLALEGYDVALLDVDVAAGEAAVAQLVAHLAPPARGARVVFKQCDVASWQSQAQSFREVHGVFGRVDVVCANAGISERGSGAFGGVEEGEPVEPDLAVMDVNLSGVIYCECEGPRYFYLQLGRAGANERASCQACHTLHEQERVDRVVPRLHYLHS